MRSSRAGQRVPVGQREAVVHVRKPATALRRVASPRGVRVSRRRARISAPRRSSSFELRGFAGVELEHVTRRRVARIGRAVVAERARRHVALHATRACARRRNRGCRAGCACSSSSRPAAPRASWMNSMPWSSSIASRNIRPRARSASSSATSTLIALAVEFDPGPPMRSRNRQAAGRRGQQGGTAQMGAHRRVSFRGAEHPGQPAPRQEGCVAHAIRNEFMQTPFPSSAALCTMRAPSTGADHRPRRTEKTSSQGVDGLEKGCMMCGSLGHFGAAGDGRRR